jgi:5-formyltetrahydrofolate cyclo-ligase
MKNASSIDTGRRKQLRAELRKRRNQLSQWDQQRASRQLLRQLCRLPVFVRSQRLACYFASDGEVSPADVVTRAYSMGKKVYMPVLNPFKQRNNLWFVEHKPGAPLLLNYYGIPEPPAERGSTPAWSLDLVLMPLVGFDRSGQRLGMGGGFYDRTFAFRTSSISQRPLLVGLAHHCQEVESLEGAAWDVPLDYIVTDREAICVGRSSW